MPINDADSPIQVVSTEFKILIDKSRNKTLLIGIFIFNELYVTRSISGT